MNIDRSRDPIKRLNSTKPKKYALKQIPDSIQDFFLSEFSLQKSTLLPNGNIVSMYKDTNTLLLTRIEEKNCVTVEYPTDSSNSWRIQYPFLYSFEDNSLYIYNIDDRTYDEYDFEEPERGSIFEMSNTNNYCFLFDDRQVMVLYPTGKFNRLVCWVRTEPNRDPLVYDLKGCKRMLLPKEKMCKIQTSSDSQETQLLIADNDSFQIWNVETSTLIFESEELSDHFFGIYWSGTYVLAWFVDKLRLYQNFLKGKKFI